MATIVVRHATGSYPVLIRAGLVARLPALIKQLAPHRTPIVITDRTVARVVTTGWRGARLVVPAGEHSKSIDRWSGLIDRLVHLGVGRGSVVVAVGGGMIGDLAGFTAASYLRGVPVIQVPTTLLAMVDASVGGKTGINTPRGKNLIGAFHPPLAVIIDPTVTATQPLADFRTGLVEAVKHGLIADPSYYHWIVQSAGQLAGRDSAAIARLVRRSVAIKARFVSRDEREAGARAALNAGHTVGHALEQASGYRLRHGDAVGLGLVVEALVAERLGLGSRGLAARLAIDLKSLGIPLRFPSGVSDRAILAMMDRDKKNRDQVIHCALVARIGAPVRLGRAWTVGSSRSVLKTALQEGRVLLR